jgi:hypothetical protein
MVARTRPSGEREVDASHAQAEDAASGLGESTADVSWLGQIVIYEIGVRPVETDRLPLDDQYVVADVDLDLLRQERQWMGTFDDNRHGHAACTDGSGALPSRSSSLSGTKGPCSHPAPASRSRSLKCGRRSSG